MDFLTVHVTHGDAFGRFPYNPGMSMCRIFLLEMAVSGGALFLDMKQVRHQRLERLLVLQKQEASVMWQSWNKLRNGDFEVVTQDIQAVFSLQMSIEKITAILEHG